jgi:two-component system phosphate regulon response regulator OmpR
MTSTPPTRPNRILVVDDDARIRDLLRRYLSQEGFEVLLAEDGRALNKQLSRETVDLIVLDLMLPGEDGLSICRRLRAGNDLTPIIMLTAKVEDVDRIVGLEVGADDYLPKPFNPRELLARINAVLRRRPVMEAPGAPSMEAMTVTFGPFEFDLGLRRLSRGGEALPLTTGAPPASTAVARQTRPTRAWPRFRAL